MKQKFTGRFVSAAAAAVLFVAGIGILPQNLFTSAADPALTGLSAEEITSQMVIGWNLGNALDCNNTGYSSTAAPEKFATAWGNAVPTQALFESIKAGGFNTVRIPTTWYEHLEYDSATDTYVINETWMDFVKQTVDYAYELDMFVILNVHHENWVNVSEFTDTTYADASAKLEDIWTQVAEKFADYDQHLIFEGMNEPRQTGLGSSVEWGTGDTYSRQYINDLNAIFVDTIRSQGSSQNSERLLMLPGYCASSQADAVRNIAVPADGGNIALSVHAYAPYFFTMDTSSYANHTFPGASGYGEDYEGNLTSLFNTLKSISDEKDTPIIIGEFSASDFNNTESRVAWATDYLTKAKAAGIPCVLWDNNATYNGTGEAHGYVNRATGTWYTNSIPVVEAMMNVYGVSYTLPEYVKVEFSWDNIPIGDDWIEIYKPSSGKSLDAWKNMTVNSMRDYMSEDYELVMVYESASQPYLVMQGGWYQITSSQVSDNPYLITFTYDDIQATLTENDVTLDSISKFYVSAGSSEMTFYGLYAVPVDNGEDSQLGDVVQDGELTVLDIVWLQRYLLTLETFADDTQEANADVNADGAVNAFDLAILKRMVFEGTAA